MTPNWTSDSTVRRLGLRHQLPTLVVATIERRRTSRWRKPERIEVALADLSASGVGFYGPDDPMLMVKEAVTIQLDGTATELRVRRADPEADGKVVRYGAEFVEGFPALAAVVDRRFGLNADPEVPPRD